MKMEIKTYCNGDITLINGDCMEYLKTIPEKSIHLIASDPPYGLEYNQNDLASQRESIFGGKIENQKANGIMNDGKEDAFRLFENMLVEGKRILANGCCCCCCCGGGGGPKPLFAEWTMMMDKHIGFKQAVVWDKGGLGMGIHYRRNYEFVLVAQNGAPAHAWNGGNNTPNVWRINKIIPSEIQHPTVKPVKLMEKIIFIHSNINDVVLDPFMGSGTTGVAAIRQGRKFIGIELDPKHFKEAVKRIENELAQERIVFNEQPIPEQTELF